MLWFHLLTFWFRFSLVLIYLITIIFYLINLPSSDSWMSNHHYYSSFSILSYYFLIINQIILFNPKYYSIFIHLIILFIIPIHLLIISIISFSLLFLNLFFSLEFLRIILSFSLYYFLSNVLYSYLSTKWFLIILLSYYLSDLSSNSLPPLFIVYFINSQSSY